jgi:aspartate/glutamate racemase
VYIVPQRLDVLAFLHQCATTMHKMARERPSSVSFEMIRIADEIAREAEGLKPSLSTLD